MWELWCKHRNCKKITEEAMEEVNTVQKARP